MSNTKGHSMIPIKQAHDVVRHRVEAFFMTDLWISLLWVCLGISTWISSSYSNDILSVFGPILVGLFRFSSPKIGTAAYYTLAFAVASDRVMGFDGANLLNPVIVWMLVLTYMAQIGRESNAG